MVRVKAAKGEERIYIICLGTREKRVAESNFHVREQ